jgi:alpha-N-acetylglucosaminidase
VNAVIKSVFELPPDVAGLDNRTGHHPTRLTYAPGAIPHALAHLLAATRAHPPLLKHAPFRYDVTDVARQALANLFTEVYRELVGAWNVSAPDVGRVRALSAELEGMLWDLDGLLGADENFLLSRWIGQAKCVLLRLWTRIECFLLMGL